MAKWSTVEVPTREVPAPGGGEVSRPPMGEVARHGRA